MKKTFIKFLICCNIALFVSCADDSVSTQPIETYSNQVSVSKEQALSIANNFLSNNKKARGLNLDNKKFKEVETIENEQEIPVMYILNTENKEGFLIVSAVVTERPILAFSDQGEFNLDNISEANGVIDWLYLKYLKIDSQINNPNYKPSTEINNQWNALGYNLTQIGIGDSNGNIIPFEPAELLSQETEYHDPLLGDIRWQQKNYGYNSNHYKFYNNAVYSLGGTDENGNPCTNTPAGCVPVAMGQIMKYYNHPNIFDIESMPPYINESNYDNSLNVGELLADIGTAVNAMYSCKETGTGANSDDAVSAFNNIYDYNTSAHEPVNFNTIVSNIRENKPVYLDGYRNAKVVVTRSPKKLFLGMSIGKTQTGIRYDDGHAWVADGFQKTTGYYKQYFNGYEHRYYATISEHIYMKWGNDNGEYNAWYDFDSWLEMNETNEISMTAYIYQQGMITNITPR